MKNKLIEIIRSVPITDKTYSEYVEALAMTLLANEYSQAPNVERNVAREIFAEADKIFMATCLSLETYKAWCELKKKYTENKGE